MRTHLSVLVALLLVVPCAAYDWGACADVGVTTRDQVERYFLREVIQPVAIEGYGSAFVGEFDAFDDGNYRSDSKTYYFFDDADTLEFSVSVLDAGFENCDFMIGALFGGETTESFDDSNIRRTVRENDGILVFHELDREAPRHLMIIFRPGEIDLTGRGVFTPGLLSAAPHHPTPTPKPTRIPYVERVTYGNFLKIREGMELIQVERMLGIGILQAEGPNSESYLWRAREGYGTIYVHFVEGRVYSKSQSGF